MLKYIVRHRSYVNFDGAPRLRNHNSDMGVKCECESEARDLARHRVDQIIQKKVRRAGMQAPPPGFIIAARERPRVSARSHVAQWDARAPGPALTHPTTRPVTYLDVPSILERMASAQSRLPVHVDIPPVLSEARSWVL